MKQITKDDVIYYKIDAQFSHNNEYQYIVDWDDGSKDNILGDSPYYIAHAYASPGKYVPTVKVIDVQKGCWRSFTLDTIYVMGVALVCGTPVIEPSEDPKLEFTLDGFYDVAAGTSVQIKHKIYLGDGQEYQGNQWSTPITISTQPYTIPINLEAELNAYSEVGVFKAWVAIDIVSMPSSPILVGAREISNTQTVTVQGVVPPSEVPQFPLKAHFTGSDTQNSSVSLGLLVDTGNGQVDISVDWGDGVIDAHTDVPLQVSYPLAHVYPTTGGSQMYSAEVTITDSIGAQNMLNYSFYITPQISIISEHAGGCHQGTDQLSLIYAGKPPYAVYFEVVLRHDGEAEQKPRCRLVTVTDNTVDTTSVTTSSPSALTWYGPGANGFTLTGVQKDFKVTLDHNIGENDSNSMLIRAYTIDSDGKMSDKVILTRCGDTNIQSVGPKGL